MLGGQGSVGVSAALAPTVNLRSPVALSLVAVLPTLYDRQGSCCCSGERPVPRENRRDEFLDAALALFVERGYEGTSVAALAEATGLTKAAFVYHFSSKEDLLFELSEPLLDDLDEVLDIHMPMADGDHEALAAALADYLNVLSRHRDVAVWIDGDKSILNHEQLGTRLDANNRRAHRLLCGERPTRKTRAMASGVLGMLWRPIRNGYLNDDDDTKSSIVELATHAARAI